MAALKKRFPALPPRENELAELQTKFDDLEKIIFASMFIGMFGGVCMLLQKKIEADSFMLLLGSSAVLPIASLLSAVAWRRDLSVFYGFMRFQEVKYKMSARFSFGCSFFLCALAIIGAISISLR